MSASPSEALLSNGSLAWPHGLVGLAVRASPFGGAAVVQRRLVVPPQLGPAGLVLRGVGRLDGGGTALRRPPVLLGPAGVVRVDRCGRPRGVAVGGASRPAGRQLGRVR